MTTELPRGVAGDLRAATGTRELWERLSPAVDARAGLVALLGSSPPMAQAVCGTVYATSREVDALLAALPRAVRALAISTAMRAERTLGELRGPVLWSETVAARAAAGGDHGVFVCASPRRGHDTAENRVLAAALRAVVAGARAAGAPPLGDGPEPTARHLHRNRVAAQRWLEHRVLADVPPREPSGRDVRRARVGPRRRVYAPAVAAWERARSPLTADHVGALADAPTAARHRLFVDLLDALPADRRATPVVDGPVVVAGPLRFVHHAARQRTRSGSLPHGVLLGDVVLDAAGVGHRSREVAAALAARAGGRPWRVVRDGDDLRALVAGAP